MSELSNSNRQPINASSQAVLDLPNEILFKILTLVESSDINSLFSINPFKARIQHLFAVVSDVVPSKHFPQITTAIPLNEYRSLEAWRSRLLLMLVEIHDIGGTYTKLSGLSHFLDNRISIFDERLPYSHLDDSKWMENFSSKTKSVTFERLRKLTIYDVSIDPKLFRFPKVEILKLIRVQSSDPCSKFDLPSLKTLFVTELFNSINSSIDYENTKVSTLTLSSLQDMHKWENVKNSSLNFISIYESGSLVKFVNLKFDSLERLIIKDSDVSQFSFIDAPQLTSIHIEQFLTAGISMHHLNLPKLKHLLLWIFEITSIYDVYMPNLKQASIMLSNEPQSSETNNIDLTCFQSVISIQICSAAEILRFIDKLEHLEVRGPFENELLFSLNFEYLRSFHIYFNNRLTQIPKINAPNLQNMNVSRCSRLSNILPIQVDYPTIKTLSIEYSELRDFIGLSLEYLEAFVYVTSTSAPVFFENCHFPKLTSFDAINLEISSDQRSSFSLDAPLLQSLRITNFSVEVLDCDFPLLRRLSAVGGVKALKLVNCQNVQDMDISSNYTMSYVSTERLEKLMALECDDTKIIVDEINAPWLEKIIDDIDGRITFRPIIELR